MPYAFDLDDMDKDLEYLRMLSIGFYVQAALSALFACIPIIHVSMGAALVSGGFAGATGPTVLFGWFFVVIGLIAITLGWAYAICMFLAGQYLASHRNYTFCFVMAVISCMFAPIGTLLGVFAVVLLLRDPAKEAFGSSGTARFVSGAWK